MKKHITLFSFMAIFFIGMQHTQAQKPEKEKTALQISKENQIAELAAKAEMEKRKNNPAYAAKMERIEAIDLAEKQTQGLHEIVKLTEDQQEIVYDLYFELNKEIKFDEELNIKSNDLEINPLRDIIAVLNINQKRYLLTFVENNAKPKK